jgi:dTDP-4-dehydrorhamnose reductase
MRLAAETGRSGIPLIHISTDYVSPAIRPTDTRLDCTAVVRAFGVQLRPWRQALEQTIHRLLINKDIR